MSKQDSQAPAPANVPEATYSKAQLLAAKRFTPQQKDILNALLTDDEQYTIGKADRQIDDFKKRKVK